MSNRNHNWTDIPGVEISFESRGEGIRYREAGREYNFDVSCAQHPLVLYARSYWDGTLPVAEQTLSDEERARIIPRLVAFMGCKGEPVEVRDEE